jgi:hypothetical protein
MVVLLLRIYSSHGAGYISTEIPRNVIADYAGQLILEYCFAICNVPNHN